VNPVGIVGGGSVAQALGRALRERGAPVVALTARHADRARRAAAFVGPSVRAVDYPELLGLTSHLIVAVSDDAISAVAGNLAAAGLRGGVAVHTCGAAGPDVLSPLGLGDTACGVFHPLQTVPSPELGADRLRQITFGIGGDPAAVAWAEEMAHLLDSRALRVAPHGFPAYHAAATLAGNAVAALVDAAIVLMERAGVDADTALGALGPLCRASADNVGAVGPAAALTGPIARGDVNTIRAHLAALDDAPDEIAELYGAVSRRLVDLATRRGLDQTAARQIGQAIGASLEKRSGQGAPAWITSATDR
jgi:predicted short-subunit dehydrogenase-like oxidoreductase (DUF2520 family)